ncbi:MAG: SIS domain-containing protein [Candidatus Aenigmarchaeota archaeon]|nr:SIS domain-containing protein [Candidatus Aenigmarchaeota archaeon]
MNWFKLEKIDSTNMKANIESQGRSISLTFSKEIEKVKFVAEKVKNCKNFVFSGCGDKYIIPLITEYIWRKYSKKPLNVIHSRILANYPSKSIDENTCVIFLSQSGTTSDVLEAFKEVKKKNAWIVCITNLKEDKQNSLIELCKSYKKAFLLNTWTEIYPEESLPSTATFHTSLALLNLLAILIFSEERILDLQVNQIPKIVDVLSRSEKLKEYSRNLALKLKAKENFYILGDGPRYLVARKAARIMFMEGVKTNACDIEAEEFIHSLIEVVERRPNILIILKPLEFWDNSMKLYKIIKNVWPKKLVIEIDPFEFIDADKKSMFSNIEGDLLSPFIYIIPLEWLSYYLALIKKVDPGKGKIVSKVRNEENLQNLFNLKN